MFKKTLLAGLLFTTVAYGQQYPSPTYNNLTVNGTISTPVVPAPWLPLSGSALRGCLGYNSTGTAKGPAGTGLDCGPTVYNALNNGAIADGNAVSVAVSITSGANALTVGSATFAAADVGKSIGIPGAGAAGAMLTTTISGFTSSTLVTIGTNASTTLTAVTARIVWGTDNTTAIQTLVTYMGANNGGTIYFPSGMYVVNGALQTYPAGGGAVGSSMILLPDHLPTIAPININFVGQFQAPYGGYSIISAQTIPSAGAILMTTQGTAGVGAIIGGASNNASYNFTNVTLGIYNITLRTYNNPQISAIDARYVTGLVMDQSAMDVGTAPNSMTAPTNSNAFAVFTPLNNNGAFTRLTNLNVVGYWAAYQINEHASVDNIDAYNSQICFVVNTANHGMNAGRMLCQHANTAVQYQNFGGVAAMNIAQLDIEWTNAGPFTRVYDILDTANAGYGLVNWHSVQAGVGVSNSFIVSGGTNLRLQQTDQKSTTYPLIQGQTKFTTTGCAVSATTGSGTAGTYTSGTTGACTVVITMNGVTGMTAPNGWYCGAVNRTAVANAQSNSASSTATCTITGTTTTGDVIAFAATPY